jgi:sec-independent protein translocase protein TatA
MLSDIKGWELLIIVGVIVLLFGAKRLPDTARGLGRSLRIFKSELKAGEEDDAAAAAAKQITVTRDDVTTEPAPPKSEQPTDR